MAVSQKTYAYKGKTFDNEPAMVLHLLDEYRCVEGFAARYLGAWKAVAQDPRVKGGLRTVCGREQLHADLLEERLRELGGTPQCAVPPERLADLHYYGATTVSDYEKLGKIAARLQNPEAILKFLTDAIAQIETDHDTHALLTTILDDERSTIACICATWQACQQA
jgi:hypothetical protein